MTIVKRILIGIYNRATKIALQKSNPSDLGSHTSSFCAPIRQRIERRRWSERVPRASSVADLFEAAAIAPLRSTSTPAIVAGRFVFKG